MNELMQASHALMEDIANIFDVIAGMKRKIKLLRYFLLSFLENIELFIMY